MSHPPVRNCSQIRLIFNTIHCNGRIFWGSTNRALDLSWWGSKTDGTKVSQSIFQGSPVRGQPIKITQTAQVALWEQIASDPWRMWRLIPVQDENAPAGLDDKLYEALPAYSAKQ